MPDRMRFAVVGAGWISQAAFIPGLSQTSNAIFAALVTGDPEKARALGSTYGVRTATYDTYESLLDGGDIDAVYVATPNWRHREHAVPALERGIPVLLEKPMATSVADAQAIAQAARQSGARLMIAYRLHCEPGTLDAIERVRSGELGDARLFSSVFTQHVSASNHRATSGYWAGPVPDMGTYPINAVRNLFGAEPVEVRAHGVRTPGRGLDIHDIVSVSLRFADDRLAQFVVGFTGGSVDQYRVVGTEGQLEVAPAFVFGPGKAITHHALVDGRPVTRAFPVTDQFAGQTDYFVQCIRDGLDPEPDAEEGLLDVIVLEAIERALTTGQPQYVPERHRARYPTPEQARTLALAPTPDIVNAAEPGGA